MEYNGCSTTTTTTTVEQQQVKSKTKVLSGGGGNDSLITNRCSQDSAIGVDDVCDLLEDEQQQRSGPSSSVGGENEGDVNSIFLCEFHPTAGPKITLQVPNDHVSTDLFRIVHQYIIPKVPLQGSFLSM